MSTDQVMEYRLSALEGSVGEIRMAVKSIDASLQILARLEQRHAETRDGLGRAFEEIKDHEIRVREIEAEMPTMKMTRGWMTSVVIGIVGIIGISIVNMAIK